MRPRPDHFLAHVPRIREVPLGGPRVPLLVGRRAGDRWHCAVAGGADGALSLATTLGELLGARPAGPAGARPGGPRLPPDRP